MIALTIEQMQTLQEKGLDCSRASMYWVKSLKAESFEWKLGIFDDNVKTYLKCCTDTSCFTPTFTLEDILNILPKPCYINCIDKDFYQCEVTTEYGSLSSSSEKTPLNAAFNLLRECIERKLINL